MAQFQPGQSGNPGGRPKVDPRVRDAARQYTDQAIAVLAAALDDEDRKVQIRAAEVLLDRGWGKAAQAVTLGGDEEMGPIRHLFEWNTRSES